ncbi:hypothetical protein P2318_32290 [Myxococcaceae bacterium GXIMD 01537]
MRRPPLAVVLSWLLVSACATSATGSGSRRASFEARKPRPPDCDFEVFEAREPPRPYRVLGTLPFESNAWVGAKGRKEALRPTACKAGADAVLLPHPSSRWLKLGSNSHEVREYEARFLLYTDVPDPEAPPPEPPPPEPPPGTVLIPAPEWVEGTWGTSTTRVEEPGASPAPSR